MADPTGISPYILATPDTAALPNSRVLAVAADSGLSTADAGPGNTFTFNTIEALNAFNNISGTGYVVALNNVSPYLAIRQMTSIDGSITITQPTGAGGNTDFAVVDNTSIQQINFLYNTVLTGTASNLNLNAGTGIDITPSLNSGVFSYTLSAENLGTVTSVGVSSTSGLLIGGSPVTSAGTITVNLPIGTLNQVLKVVSVSPYTLGFATDGGGTVTSVTVSSTSGLLIGGSPITTTGNITVNLPTGTLAQILAVTSVSPYTLGFVDATPGTLATYLCQTSLNLPTNGVNLGATNAKLGIGLTTPTAFLDIKSTSSARIFNSVSEGSFSGVSLFDNYQAYVGDPVACSYFGFRGARGTSDAPTASGTGDLLNSFYFSGYGDSAFKDCAAIYALAAGDFTNSSSPGTLKFLTTPVGATAIELALTINSDKSAIFEGAVTLNGGVTLPSGKTATFASGSTTTFNNTPTFNDGLTVTANSIAITTAGTGLVTSAGTTVAFSGAFTLNTGSVTTYSNGSSAIFASGSTFTLSAGSALNANGLPSSGNVLTYNGTNVIWAAPSGDGTVTSVDVSSSDAFITVSGGPVTTSGTIALTINTLGATKGGTAQSTYATGDTLYASAANTLSKLTIGIQGQVYAVSAGGIPSWTNTIDGTGALTIGATGVSKAVSVIGTGAVTIGANTVSQALNLLGTGTVTIGNASDVKAVTFTSGVTATFNSGSTLTAAIGSTVNLNTTINQAITTGALHSASFDNASGGGDIIYDTYGGTTGTGPALKVGYARGTLASPTAVINNDRLGFLIGRGYNGSAMTNGSNITIRAKETWSGSARGSDIQFFTVPLTTTTPILALTINADQSCTFAGQIGGTGGFSLTAGGFNISAGGGTGTFNNTGGNTFGSASPLIFNNAPSFTNGGSLAGTFSGSPTFSGTPIFSAGYTVSAGTNSIAGTSTTISSTTNTISGTTLSINPSSGTTWNTGFATVSGVTTTWVSSSTLTIDSGATVNCATNPSFTGGVTFAGSTFKSSSDNRFISNVAMGADSAATHTLELFTDDAAKTTTTLWATTSDARVKTNIVDTEEALPLITALNPRKYNYTEEWKKAHRVWDVDGNELPNPYGKDIYYGFIADEVMEVVPSCVTITDQVVGSVENVKMLNSHNLNILLFKAVKELAAKVEDLEAKLAVLAV